MDKELKQKWVEKLRSDEYEQCTGQLKRPPKEVGGKQRACCLGVLCDVAGIPVVEEGSTIEPSIKGRSLLTSYGFIEQELLGGHDFHNLVDLNDNLQRTFPEIADYVEENL